MAPGGVEVGRFMKEPALPDSARSLITHHPRDFESNRYVYPVLSRRCGGISIGINLNRDKVCNFDCIYCQVDRTESPEKEFVEIDRLVAELDAAVSLVASGDLYDLPHFRETPPTLRRLGDIAMSGDGEPTTYRNFDRIVAACAEVRRRHHLDDTKLVLITNASMLHRESVRRGLEILADNGGEIWAKLDAGTESAYRRVARSAVPFSRILENLQQAARIWPLVIQSLFMRIRGVSPPLVEIRAYCERLVEVLERGGRINLVQIYTVARRPAESWVEPLSASEIDALAAEVRRRTGLPVSAYP